MVPFDFAQGRLPHDERLFLNPLAPSLGSGLALSASKGLK